MMLALRDNSVDHEAAIWVARMDGDWSAEQEQVLADWLARDARRQGALLRAQAAWLTPDSIIPDEPDRAGDGDRDRSRGTWLAKRRDVLTAGMGAFAASAVVGFGWIARASRYRTGVGEIRHVPLADGSVAAINTSSDITVSLGTQQRDIVLDHGEAWFQVAKDPARPFIVRAGSISVEAIGTAFSVRRRADGAEILVSEGVVAAWSSADAERRVDLAAGQRATIGDDAWIALEPAAPSAVDRALAWRAGMVDLLGEPLGEAIAEFNRYNRQQIELRDKRLAGEQFDGVFRTDDPQGFARAVQASLGVPVDLSDPAHIRIG